MSGAMTLLYTSLVLLTRQSRRSSRRLPYKGVARLPIPTLRPIVTFFRCRLHARTLFFSFSPAAGRSPVSLPFLPAPLAHRSSGCDHEALSASADAHELQAAAGADGRAPLSRAALAALDRAAIAAHRRAQSSFDLSGQPVSPCFRVWLAAII